MTVYEFGWTCLNCDAAGTGDGSDKQAEKHAKTMRHGTRSWMRPMKERTHEEDR